MYVLRPIKSGITKYFTKSKRIWIMGFFNMFMMFISNNYLEIKCYTAIENVIRWQLVNWLHFIHHDVTREYLPAEAEPL